MIHSSETGTKMTEINRNLDLGLGQVHQCDRVKPFNENPTLPYSKKHR
jgi:hypothetical protein